MTHNINILSYINNAQNGYNISNPGDAGKQSGINAIKDTADVISQIKNLLVGEVFTGEVTDISGENVTIRFDSGKALTAKMQQDVEGFTFQKGELVTFQVSDKTDSQVSIKPLDIGGQEYIMASRALEAAGVVVDEENLSMIKGLIDLNMPIDKNTINNVIKLLNAYPDTDMNTVLRMYKLDIPVNVDNINVFEAYKHNESNIASDASKLARDISNLPELIINSGENNKAAKVTADIIELFSKDENTFSQPEKVKEFVEKLIEKTGSLKEDFPAENNREPENYYTVREFAKLISRPEVYDSDTFREMLGSDEFKDFIESIVKEKTFIKPEEFADKEEVRKFFEELDTLVKEGEKLLKRNELTHTDAFKGFNSVKSNVSFMNDLSRQLAFVQIPVKFNEGERKGDLYVYANRKSRVSKGDECSALLHLDMANLGSMDIYVKLSQVNISTNFCLESEEMLDFIYEHIDILTKRLNDKGYSFTPTMTVKDDKGSFEFEKDFLDKTDPVVPVSRYLFDIKA